MNSYQCVSFQLKPDFISDILLYDNDFIDKDIGT